MSRSRGVIEERQFSEEDKAELSGLLDKLQSRPVVAFNNRQSELVGAILETLLEDWSPE